MAPDTTKFVASKPCVIPDCTGTMHFRERREVADAPHTLDWPWFANWRCDKDPAHSQVISPDEERALRANASAH